MVVFGLITILQGFTQNFSGLIAARFFLGLAESGFFPGCCYMISMWYRREEQALVIGAFYSMNGFQQCVGGLIAYGVAQIQGQALKNWQILFTVSPDDTSCTRSCYSLSFRAV